MMVYTHTKDRLDLRRICTQAMRTAYSTTPLTTFFSTSFTPWQGTTNLCVSRTSNN